MHGNSNKNKKLHHLYEIRDSVEDDVFKYGISHDPIDEDGMSKRSRDQVDFLNLGVGWLRFFVRILIRYIPGRVEAKRLEKGFIQRYANEHGYRPRGNRERTAGE
ncbi:MAG TPA: hypothetical protein ENJ95_21155 [Bacteroidetes bacterium]|nr:hypothetical protein [Bacteroidota bacterium]